MTDLEKAAAPLLGDAFRHLETAIELLDLADAPGTITAHADLAARQLEEFIAASGQADSVRPVPARAPWPQRLAS